MRRVPIRFSMFILGVTTLTATSLRAQDVTARLGWLAGCWEARDGARTTFEMWSPPSGGMLVGAGRTVVDGRARAHEHLRLHAEGDTLVYTALPSGQAETRFRSTAITDSSLVVENKAHDFPQRISYRRAGTDSLTVRVEGPGPDGMRGFSLAFARVGCSWRQMADGRRQTADANHDHRIVVRRRSSRVSASSVPPRFRVNAVKDPNDSGRQR